MFDCASESQKPLLPSTCVRKGRLLERFKFGCSGLMVAVVVLWCLLVWLYVGCWCNVASWIGAS